MDEPIKRTRRRWPHPRRGPWWLEFSWGLLPNRRIECFGFEIRSFDDTSGASPPRPLTASLLRRIPIVRLIDVERSTHPKELGLAFARGYGGPDFVMVDGKPMIAGGVFVEDVGHSQDELAGRRRGRPARYTRQHYEQVAVVYLQAFRAGSRRPTALVAEHWNVSRSTAAKWVAAARNPWQLIGPTKKGFAGERPTTRHGRKR